MAAFSQYLADMVGNLIFKNNGNAFSSPGDSIYIALFVGSAGLETNAPTQEVSGGSYARVQVIAADWTEDVGATPGNLENTNAITFPQASAAWGTISHVAIMDASSGGNVLLWGALTASKVVNNGDQFKFNAGDLDINFL